MARHLLLSFGVLVFLGTPCLVPAELNPVLAARVALIFPFLVGQQYEFQASRTFTRPNGVILPAYTIDTVTVTDTTINEKRWFHVPYWSAFGSEYYRLDDSLRVWNVSARTGEERILFYLGYTGWRFSVGGPVMCMLCNDVAHTNNVPVRPAPRIQRPFDVAYSPNYMSSFTEARSGWTISKGLEDEWQIQDGDSTLGYAFNTCCPNIGLGEVHGESGPGTVQHRKYETTSTWFVIRLYGYFRPVSADRWPPPFGEPVAIREEGPSHSELALSAHPNPFNGSATIRFALSRKSTVTLAVYASTGQLVRRLADGEFGAGTREVIWDGRNEHGDSVSSGVYIARLTTPYESVVTRVTIAR